MWRLLVPLLALTDAHPTPEALPRAVLSPVEVPRDGKDVADVVAAWWLGFRLGLSDPDPEVRLAAVGRLVRCGDHPAVVPCLVRVLEREPDDAVGFAAVEGLIQLGPKAVPAVPSLVGLTEGRGRMWPSIVRNMAEFRTPWDILRAIGPRAVPAVIPLLTDRDPVRRYQATRVVADLLTGRAPTLFERRALYPGLVPHGDAATTVLRQAAEHPSAEIREAALRQLRLLGPKRP